MRKTLTILSAILFFNTSPAFSEEKKLATGNDYEPYTDQDLLNGGMITDIVRTAYQEAGQEVKFSFKPWKRVERSVLKGDALAAFPYVKTQERMEKYAYTDEIFVARAVPIVSEKNKGTILSLDDMKEKTICQPIGWSSGNKSIENMIESGQINQQNPRNMDMCFRLLLRERVDFMVMDHPTVPIRAEKAIGGMDKIHIEDFAINKTRLYLIFDKESDQVEKEIEDFNQYLSSIKENGMYDQIVDTHLDK